MQPHATAVTVIEVLIINGGISGAWLHHVTITLEDVSRQNQVLTSDSLPLPVKGLQDDAK